MSYRNIDLGNRRWKSPKPPQWPWRTSRAGNGYTEIKGVTYVVTERHGSDGVGYYTWGCYAGPGSAAFRPSGEQCETLDEAKAAALRAGGVGAPLPVPVSESSEPAPTAKRRIDL